MTTRDLGQPGDDPPPRHTQLLSVVSVAEQFDCSRHHVYRLIDPDRGRSGWIAGVGLLVVAGVKAIVG